MLLKSSTLWNIWQNEWDAKDQSYIQILHGEYSKLEIKKDECWIEFDIRYWLYTKYYV